MKKLLLALAVMATVLTVGLAVMPDAGATADPHKWYVCKYVGPPGSGEVLQGGDNPIFVDENAIDVDPVVVGATFGDAQSHSVVIVGPYATALEVEPVCPGTPPPTTTTVTVPPTTTVPPVTTTTTVPPVTTTTTVPPTRTQPPPPCKGSVSLGPWYGDPRINITLTGSGTFVVSGGVQRFTGLTTITKTLACGEVFRIGRYKIEHGHYLMITQDSVLITHIKPPRVRL